MSLPPRAFGIHAAAVLVCFAAASADAGEVHEYRVEVDSSLSRMHVSARFASPADSITAKSSAAGKYLIDARDCDGPSPIRLRNRRMMLPVDGIRCMSYTVDLAGAGHHHRYNGMLDPENVVISPSLWLWRPRLAGDTEIDVRFVLPPDVRVSVPWQPVPGDSWHYRLARSPESSDAPAAFGRFLYRELAVPGAVLKVSILRGRDMGAEHLDVGAIADWLRAAATDVTLAYGRFPNPSPQVVVIPITGGREARSASAVPFGQVIRDGGEAVQLFVERGRSLDAFLGDWTATHEFSHLMLPYLAPEHRWVSEGFAQYYQNVLLARSGTYDTERAWQKLYEGFERGRRSRPELSPNAAAERGIRSARMKIYWSGAALALMADVELRRRSGGAETLDDVLGHLQSCCLPSGRTWSAPELFRTLDALASHPVFMPLYRRYADAAGFPDTRPLLERLGVDVTDTGVRLRREGELAVIRSAITAIDPAAARWREQLAAHHRASKLRAAGSR
ncbi:MAG TPA: hypothetical protein VE175_01225 [Woeseiaceae bacterium]|nr:hypothetical protein [Woeseiaceae bacterium]